MQGDDARYSLPVATQPEKPQLISHSRAKDPSEQLSNVHPLKLQFGPSRPHY